MVKHVGIDVTGAVGKLKCLCLVRKSSSGSRIQKKIGKGFLFVKCQQVIFFIVSASDSRNIKCRMSANCEIHRLIAVVYHFPAHADLIFLQHMFDLKLKIIWIIFFCCIGRFQFMCNRICSHIHAGKFTVSGKPMLFGRIFSFTYTVVILKMASNIRKKNRRMTFPVSRICLPDHFSVMYFIKNAVQFSTVIVYRYFQIVIFNCVNHKWILLDINIDRMPGQEISASDIIVISISQCMREYKYSHYEQLFSLWIKTLCIF